MTQGLADGRRISILAACLILVGGILSPAAAQDSVGTYRPGRPNRAIFGGGYGTTEHALIVTGQVGAGLSTFDQGNSADGVESARLSEQFTNFGGGLSYTLSRNRFAVSSGLDMAAQYIPSPAEGPKLASAASGHASLRVDVTGRTTVESNLGISREPLSALSLLPGLYEAGGGTSALDYGLGFGRETRLRYSASAGLTHGLTSRASLNFGYYRSFAEGVAGSVDNQGAGLSAGVSYQVGAGLSARAGYGRDYLTRPAGVDQEQAPAPQLVGQRVDAGLDFSRTLSLSRRTSLSFETGAIMLRVDGQPRYHVLGGALLRREIGRTWFGSLAYNRDLTLVTIFQQPTFTESVTGMFSGLIGRRVSVSSHVGGARGDIGLGEAANGYILYRAGAGVTLGLARDLGLGLHYSFFNYRFDQVSSLPEAFRQREMSSHAIRVGLDVMVPIFHRARRP